MLKGASDTLGESLIRSNMLSTDQLVSALRWQQNSGGALDDALVELGFVSRDNLNVVNKGAAKGGGTIDLAQHVIDASLVNELSVDLCYRKKILPITREEIGETSLLTLAMAGGANVDTIDQVRGVAGSHGDEKRQGNGVNQDESLAHIRHSDSRRSQDDADRVITDACSNQDRGRCRDADQLRNRRQEP